MNSSDIQNEIEILKQTFEKANIDYQLNPGAKLSSATVKRLKKQLPEIPEAFISFFESFNRFQFKWSDGEISMINLQHLVTILENNMVFTRENKQRFITLGSCQNSKLLCRLDQNELKIFFSIDLVINHQFKSNIYPLDITLHEYLKKAIQFRGVPFWEFVDNPGLWDELKTSVSPAEYLDELNGLFASGKAKIPAWVDILQNELSAPNPIGIKKLTLQNNRLVLPMQITIELNAGHPINKEIAGYYNKIRDVLELQTTLNGKHYTSLKISGYRELFLRQDSKVWNYLGVSKKGRLKHVYYSYNVLIYKETPIFIDLSSTDAYNLYYYAYSEDELYKIDLTFTDFMSRLFQCHGVEDWEKLFIPGKNTFAQETIDKIKTVVPHIDMDTFLKKSEGESQ